MPRKMLTGIDLNAKKAANAADGTNPTDLVTKQQLDAVLSSATRGTDWKNSARVASTANVTVANPGTASFDGITLSNGDRILLKDQTTTNQNGIYVFNGSASALTRATDFDDSTEVTAAAVVPVEIGTANGGGIFVLTGVTGAVTIGTTALTFSRVSGASYTAANDTITVSGLTLSVKLKSGGGILFDANGLFLDPSKVGTFAADCVATTNPQTFTHGKGTRDVAVSVWDKSVDPWVKVSTDPTLSANGNDVVVDFGGAPAAGQFRVVVK